jgi:hypothetical protein
MLSVLYTIIGEDNPRKIPIHCGRAYTMPGATGRKAQTFVNVNFK